MIQLCLSVLACIVVAGLSGEAVTNALYTADPLEGVLRFIEDHVSVKLVACRYCFTAWPCLASCLVLALATREPLAAAIAWLPSWGLAIALRAAYDLLLGARAAADSQAKAGG